MLEKVEGSRNTLTTLLVPECAVIAASGNPVASRLAVMTACGPVGVGDDWGVGCRDACEPVGFGRVGCRDACEPVGFGRVVTEEAVTGRRSHASAVKQRTASLASRNSEESKTSHFERPPGSVYEARDRILWPLAGAGPTVRHTFPQAEHEK